MKILGISALYHDAAAALVDDGRILAAAQEERFTRIKHDKALPVHAVRYCLEEGQCLFGELDAVVYYDNPFLSIQRFCENASILGKDAADLVGRSLGAITGERVWVKERLLRIFGEMKEGAVFLISRHHLSHAASAFYPSPFSEALILTNDGVGEWDTSTLGVGYAHGVRILRRIRYPHSLGLFYSAFTYFCGFKVNEGDYKFMGLAPYGEPVYEDLLKKQVIDIKEDGSYRLYLDCFDYHNGRTMISGKMAELFGGARREPESRITKREMDLAASVQKVTEEVIVKQARFAKSLRPDLDSLVLAGGCALNCTANGRLLREGIFQNIWIQPAAGDAGGALGAALYAYYDYFGNPRKMGEEYGQRGSYLGKCYLQEALQEALQHLQQEGAVFHRMDERHWADQVAALLAEGNVVGMFAGREEYGPRALGNRSILADPRDGGMQSKLNQKIKFRESFRPFAPAVLAERAKDYFDICNESPYMLFCADVKKELRCEMPQKLGPDQDMIPVISSVRSEIPAVTHVDYSARVQTVTREKNSRFYELLKAFERLTGCGVLVNTSFNVRGEPIVHTPWDAYQCFMRTDMDVLVLEHVILFKHEQPAWIETEDWRDQYAPD